MEKHFPFKCGMMNLPCIANPNGIGPNVVSWIAQKPTNNTPATPNTNSNPPAAPTAPTPQSQPGTDLQPPKKRQRRSRKVSPSPPPQVPPVSTNQKLLNINAPIKGTILLTPISPPPPTCKVVMITPKD